MPPPERGASPGEALLLGLLQGPGELLPISSSAHMSLIPWLAGWRYGELDGAARKSFEIAVHAGAGLALAIGLRGEVRRAVTSLDRERLGAWTLALGPPGMLGVLLRGPIERRLAGPKSIAAGLLAGGVAMALADSRGAAPGSRGCDDFKALDGLALGLAQTLALAPGVSRNGATLAAARARGYRRRDAQVLSWRAGLPVILAASALEGTRMLREGPRGDVRAPVLGGLAAFVSTRAVAGPRGTRALRGRRLAPYSVYRCVLGALVVVRLRRAQ